MNSDDFVVKKLDEPNLVFADDEEMKDPRAGLLKYGPCQIKPNNVDEVVNVGIVGDRRSISAMADLLREMRYVIESEKKRKRWKHPFPGLGAESNLNFDYQLLNRWKGPIHNDEIEDLSNISNRKERIEFAFRLIESQLDRVCSKTPSPDVVFVTIPERIVEFCSDSNTDTDKIRTEDGDFRSRIKIAGMEKHTPTQLMSPGALHDEKVQERSEVAWNVAVGMLYKARQGRPWKLGKLRSRTCYAGISFYEERGDDPDMRASVAQVFIPDGRHFVIRGEPVQDIASDTAQTHLSQEDAKKLLENILDKFGDHVEERPNRLVLHKSSNFREEESKGFQAASEDIAEKDFITIREHHPLRLFPPKGDYPVLRGTLIVPPGEKECYLYTKGFVAEQVAYTDPGTPNPIVVKPDEDVFTGDYQRVCDEIMAFTKLDWNSSDFCTKRPVTIRIADRVSDILAEPAANDVTLQTHYYYYM